jgi:hypothetical protein
MNTKITTANTNRHHVHAYRTATSVERHKRSNSLTHQKQRLREIAARDHPDGEFVL